ncbi:MAG: methyltransferase [Acidilobus sp.]
MAHAGRWASVITRGGRVLYYQDPCVYEPSDDTWAAVEAIEKLAELDLRIKSVLDLGSGTGVLGSVARFLLRPALLMAVDISPFAVSASRKTLGPDAGVVQCDAGDCLRGQWDLVIVNPPYLPTQLEDDEACSGALSYAWSEEAGHRALCVAAGLLGRRVLIVRSSISRLNVDSCLSSLGLSKVAVLARKRLFFEEVWAELWAKEAD